MEVADLPPLPLPSPPPLPCWHIGRVIEAFSNELFHQLFYLHQLVGPNWRRRSILNQLTEIDEMHSQNPFMLCWHRCCPARQGSR